MCIKSIRMIQFHSGHYQKHMNCNDHACLSTLIKLRPALETSRAALERSSRTLVNTCSVTSYKDFL